MSSIIPSASGGERPDTSKLGSSPLVEQIDSSVTEVRIMPGFGNRLQVVFCGNEGMPEVMPGAVAAVTVYGDGRIEYHTATQVEGGESR